MKIDLEGLKEAARNAAAGTYSYDDEPRNIAYKSADAAGRVYVAALKPVIDSLLSQVKPTTAHTLRLIVEIDMHPDHDKDQARKVLARRVTEDVGDLLFPYPDTVKTWRVIHADQAGT